MRGETPEEYEFLDVLGSGGFARVYRARCLRTGERVAIKKIDKAVMAAKGMEGRVRQEVIIHSRLKHPSVLELHTFFEDADYVYLVLELAHNGEIARHFRREPVGLSEAVAADILRQVVDGVLYLHSHRIVHRDLSLNNLLLTEDFKVKIADFGLATQLNAPDEKHLTMCGTPNYISPEVASRSHHGLPADVWGLGCLLYTLLAGRPPFDTSHVKRTLDRVIRADYKMPPGLSRQAQDLLEKLLRKNPAERITLAEIVRHPFLEKRSASAVHKSSEDSGFHTTSTTHHRTRSMERTTSSSGGDMLFRHRQNSTDRLTTHRSRPASFNNVLAGISNNTSSSENSDHQCSRKHHGSSLLENILSAKNNLDNMDRNIETKEDEPMESNHEIKENLLAGSRSIGVAPLCTTRLQEITHRTRNSELSITSEGSAIFKYIKKRGRHREDRVTEVCIITKDGMQVVVYPVKDGKGCPVNSLPEHTPSPGETFSYHNLPQKHWKKYVYAACFVDMVKAKTPKVTIYTSQAKCHMMESRTDFEGVFLNGIKITVSPNGFKIIDKDGNVHRTVAGIQGSVKDAYDHFQENMKKCLEVESALHNLSEDCFPLVMGKRLQSASGTVNQSPQITPTILNGGSINIGSFCHSTGVSRVSDSNQGNVKRYNPLGEAFGCANLNREYSNRKLNVGYSNFGNR